MYIYVCEDSLAGIFTGVYDAWAGDAPHEEKRLITGDTWNFSLFAEYVTVKTDAQKSRKVMRTLKHRCGQEAYDRLCYAAMSDGIDKADAIYHALVKAFSLQDASRIFEDMHTPAVMRTFELSRSVQREASHLYGFLRFRELEGGLLFAVCAPRYHITTILAEHFADRFPMENFVIINESDNEAACHMSGGGYFLCDLGFLDKEKLAASETEEMFQSMWKDYCSAMTIAERKNPKLQMQMFPKKYWKYSVEFGTQRLP